MSDDDDPFDRHAPEGFQIAMQFWDGETEEQAIRETARVCELPPTAVVAVPGHYEYDDEHPDAPPTFRPHGWMVFVRHDP